MKSKVLKKIAIMSKYAVYGMILQTVLCTFIFASEGEAQRKSLEEILITVELENVKIEEAFSRIEGVTEFDFAYKKSDLDKSKRITLSSENETLSKLLLDIARETGLQFRRIDETINVNKARDENDAVSDVLTQKGLLEVITVSGRVTDNTGAGIPGVNVLEKGTSNGTITDFEGYYKISADESATLVLSFVGYKAKEVPIGGKQTLDVVLEEDVTSLEEIVVVGFGEQKKINLTGAVSSVKFDDETNNRPITNASQALGGKATGLWVSQNSGKPGSDGAQLRVRGWGTLNNSNPLVMVDGIEGSFDQLNPNDIESVTILKDAASAAIYGSKAANGVILVTTKLGKKGDKMSVNVSSYVGTQRLGRRYNSITNSAEVMDIINQGLINDGASALFPDYLINDFNNGNDKYKYPNTDWFDELFQNAGIQEHNLSLSGGSEQTSSFLSFNYLNQDGMVPNTSSQRYGIRANVENNVNKWLNVGGRLNYIRKNSNEPYADATYGSLGRVFEMLGGAAPFIAPYTADGRYGSVQALDNGGNLLYDNRNPLIDADNGKTNTDIHYATINAFAEVKLAEGLNVKTTIASTNNWALTDKFNESVFGYTDTGVETTTKNFNREGLEISRRNVATINNSLFSTLNYHKTFAEQHDISSTVGIQLQSTNIKDLYARRTMAPKEGLTQVDAGTSGIQGTGNFVGLNMYSYFGRVNYAFLDRYLFEVNLRADASSRFMDGSRWGVFPGFSAGWRIIDEPFMQNVGLFSNLKLRASWGQLGNQNIAGYWPYLTVIEQSNPLSYSYGGVFSPGAAVTSLVDQNITWETSSTLDVGIDMGLFDGKVTVEADYFKKETTDIIVQLPIPRIMGGITAPYENVGEMVNSGLEFIVNYDNHSMNRDVFGYNVGMNFTYIDNEVTKFRGGDSPDQLYLIREGYSYQSLYGFKAEGIYQSDNEALEHMNANGFKPKAGNIRFEDVNGDGRLGFEDKQGLGNTIPKLTFGITSSLKYKGFDLNILFQGIGGVNVYTQNNFTNISFENQVFSETWRDAWTPENTNTDVPMIRFNNSWDNQQSSYWVRKLNYIKLKNIQVGYAFDKSVLERVGFQRIYLFANAQNVFSIVSKDYEGYDPERNTFDNGYNLYPIPVIVTTGINLNF
ncbi:MAG: SusC/RagA family TonB-linked outer membrane protein [Imperialibacter sp.]|uniref:SusC/RagA family TonB-linked outer membrane protein n=1 Tax=Imperialibacter sp. TaxID=2038411 RepID=UPI003A8563ED